MYKIIKTYNYYHSDVIELLNKIDESISNKILFYSSELYKNKKEEIILIIFTTVSMILIDLVRKEIKTQIYYSFISKYVLEDSINSIKFQFKESYNKVKFY